jgi:hypothetical protein
MGHIKIFGKTKIEGKTVFSQSALLYDSTAAAYIAAVEAADGQALESSIKIAYNDFIVGCKSDGIWSAIKASCILAGARTLSGALVPLVGSAPTNFNFVSADYNRKTGLVGNGSTKYLNSNRNNNADPQNNNHNAAYISFLSSTNGTVIGSTATGTSTNGTNFLSIDTNLLFSRNRSQTGVVHISTGVNVGFAGVSRSNSTSYTARGNGVNYTTNITSQSPENASLLVFRRPSLSNPTYSLHRLSFYSIGESLDLVKLDTRVSALMTAINAAI